MEEYCQRVTREADMDVDLPLPSPVLSWADQVKAEENIQQSTPLEIHVPNTPPSPPPLKAPMDITPSVIPYDVNKPADPSLWNGQFQTLSIFGTKETFGPDSANIAVSLNHAAEYIKQRDLNDRDPNCRAANSGDWN